MQVQKIKKAAALLLIAFAVTAALIKLAVSITTEPSSIERPTAAQAFQKLYGTPTLTTKVILDKKQLASFWFDQEINDGESGLYFVFSKKQELDENGEIVSCHACSATIDVITFARRHGEWVKENINKDVIRVGSFGDAPKISKAATLQLSPRNFAFLIPTMYTGMGVSSQGIHLLSYLKEEWSSVGYLDIAGNNFGTSCIKKDSSPDVDTTNNSPCYSYKSTFKVMPGGNSIYPNIIVSRRGNDYSFENDRVQQVGDEIYVFNGKKYLSNRQNSEELERVGLDNESSSKIFTMDRSQINEIFTTLLSFLLVLIAIAIYFFPSSIAKLRKHHQATAIFVLNIFLGWTLLGWVVALVWAATAIPKETTTSSSNVP